MRLRGVPFAGRVGRVALLFALTVGCGADDECDGALRFDASDLDPDTLLVRCDVAPELCDRPVASEISEPDLDAAIDVVFVSDGYTEAQLGAFAARAADLTRSLRSDAELVGRDVSLFNFHRVDIVSTSDQPSERPLRTCASAEGFRGGDNQRAARAAANAPDADFVVVLVPNGRSARAAVNTSLGGLPIIYVVDEEFTTVTHEMGHGLFGLGDEYVEFDGRHVEADLHDPETPDPLPPNLSLSPDEDWEGWVEGAVEGGGRWSNGIYRPTDSCRMLDPEHPRFCPVCAHIIARTLRGRRGESEGPPECLIAARFPVEGVTQLEIIARDANGIATVRLTRSSYESEIDVSALGRIEPWFDLSTSLPTGESVQVECIDTQGEASTTDFTAR